MTSTSDNTNSVDNAVARGIEYLRRIVADMEEWGDEEAFVYFQHRPDLDPFDIHDAEGNIRGRLAKGEADIIAHFRECREVPELIVVDGNQDHCKVKAHQRRREQEQRRREQLSDEATIQEVVRREPFSSMPWSGAGCMEEDVYMPATMVRTRECSGIAELDQWLMPLRDALTREAVLAELDNVTAAHSLFSWCRCKSIDTQDRMLQSLVQKVSIPRIGAENPWDALCFEHRCSCSKVASAAALVVAARRYPDAGIVPDVVARATDFLHNSQDKDGSWPVSSGGKCSDYLVGILETAMAIHATCLTRPSGWQRLVDPSCTWLVSQQHEKGFWSETPENPAWLTVVVLDALELAQGGTRVTFEVPNDLAGRVETGGWEERQIFQPLSIPGERSPLERVCQAFDLALSHTPSPDAGREDILGWIRGDVWRLTRAIVGTKGIADRIFPPGVALDLGFDWRTLRKACARVSMQPRDVLARGDSSHRGTLRSVFIAGLMPHLGTVAIDEGVRDFIQWLSDELEDNIDDARCDILETLDWLKPHLLAAKEMPLEANDIFGAEGFTQLAKLLAESSAGHELDGKPREGTGSTPRGPEANPNANWSRPYSKKEAAGMLGLTVPKINGRISKKPECVERINRQTFRFDKNDPLFEALE